MTENPFAESAAQAGKKVDAKYGAEIEALVMPTKEKLERLFPSDVDKKALSRLIEITQKANNDIELFEKIKSGSAELGKSAFKLLKSFLI